MKKITTKNIVLCGLLTAIAVVLGGVLSMRFTLLGAYNLKVSFAVVPCTLAGMIMGPVYGFVVGFLTDMATAFLFPVGGSYLPAFSVIMGGMGMTPALLSYPFSKLLRRGRETWGVLFPSVLVSQFLFSTIANTGLLAYLMLSSTTESFSAIFRGLIAGRALSLILVPFHAAFCAVLLRVYRKAIPLKQ